MRRFAHLGAALASASLAVSGLAVMTAPSAEALLPKSGAAKTAAGNWLAGQLTSGIVHNDQFNFDDYGLTVDFGIAFKSLSRTSDATAVQNAMASHINDYVTPSGFGTHSYTGGLAKLAAFVGHPTDEDYGSSHVNLISQLSGRVISTGPSTGRIEDVNFTPGDQFDDDAANSIGQVFAARALSNASDTKAASALSFLLQQQCPNGGFRLSFTADKAAAGQSCTSNAQANIDTTALAVSQLSTIGGASSAVADAKAWLRTVQNCDGSFGSGDDGENANSTGLAAIALADSVASQEAARWLNRHQAYSGTPGLSDDIGALARNDADFTAGKASGISVAKRDAWRRATAQAAFGLDNYSTAAAPLIHAGAVTGWRKAGSKVAFAVTGADTGTVVCLGATKAFTSSWGVTMVGTLPAGTGNRVFTVKDGYGNTASTTVKALGPQKLTVTKNKAKVKKNKYLTVTVAGLQPGETGRIYFRGSFKASGPANSQGRFTHGFKVGKKKGKASIAGYGVFGDIRKGYNSVKVK